MSKLPKFSSRAFVAPMAGITDPAFRLLCKQAGAGLVVTEFTSVHAIVEKEKQLKSKELPITRFLEYSEKERPVSAQLFGHDIDMIIRAAKIIEPYFDIIDFNMGCPAPHITNQMAGAALLSKPDHVKELFTRLVKAVDKPVTLKLRAGISNENCYLYKPIAKAAEECGVQMITLHARTLKQGYSGKADWSLIKELKESVSVPVVGNGDIAKPEDAKKMIDDTGCDYVMIGRGALGNPLLFKQINNYLSSGSYEKITTKMQLEQFYKYLENTREFHINYSTIKVQAMQFIKGLHGAVRVREKITMAKSVDDLKKVFDEYEIKNRQEI